MFYFTRTLVATELANATKTNNTALATSHISTTRSTLGGVSSDFTKLQTVIHSVQPIDTLSVVGIKIAP